jgi:carboxypeptidase D
LNRAKQEFENCEKEFKPPITINYSHCEKIVDTILDASRDGGKYCLNKYDFRLRDHGPNEGCGMSWPPGVSEMGRYLSVFYRFTSAQM